MRKLTTRQLCRMANLTLLLFSYLAAQAVYVPVTLTGFRADVIANGIGLPTTSTTLAFDSAASTGNYVLLAQDYQSSSTSTLPTSPFFLPTSGTLNSLVTSGLSYQLAPYNALNSLRLVGTSAPANTGMLTFPLPNTLIGDVYILGSTGSGSATATAVITFTDNSTQTASSSFVFPDWFATTPAPAVQGFSRAFRGTGAIDASSGPGGNPRFFEWRIPLNITNYTKTIKSVTITRTTGSATTSVLNIMAITVDHQPCLPTQNLALSGSPTMTTANFTWTANAGSTGYDWAVTTTATPPATPNGTVTTNSANVTGLNNGTTYWFHVRNKCSGTSTSIWNTIQFSTPACPTVPSASVTVTGTTTISGNVSWTALAGSQGYDVGHNTSATVPPTSFTTQTTTTYAATGLTPGTTYYFWIRNKCATPSNSVWTNRVFTTAACPLAGAPVITANTPGNVSFSWPGTTTPGVTNYQWAVTLSTALPTTWNTTSATTASTGGLVPGSTYFIHVRSNCSASQSTYTPFSFVNPFPPCAAPATLSITNVNMRGANINWSASPNVVNGYQYALTTSATPPTTGLTLTTDTFFTPINLIGGQKYYVYVRTHCGANSNNVINFSSWAIDSFITPLTCQPTLGTSITSVTPSTAQIQWTNYPGVLGYEYVLNANPTPPPANFTGATVLYHTLSAANLLSGTSYYFHVRVRCDSFNFSPWTSTPFNTPAICNTAPSTPILTATTPTTATFGWSAVQGAQQYQYSVSTNNVPNPNSNTFTSTNSAKVLGLNPSGGYHFHVRAYCSPNDLSEWESVPFSTAPVSVNAIGSGKGYNVVVYPNPVKDLLQVEISGAMNGKGTLQLLDMNGKLLKTIELNDVNTQIDMSGLPQGIYLLRYRDAESAGTIKLNKR